MSRRDERRRRIEGSFEEFRKAVAAALGNASREHRVLADERPRVAGALGRPVDLGARHLVGELERRVAPRPLRHHAAGALAEPDELRVLPRSRREALRRDMERLEQVRLARAVRPHDEHETLRQPELERRVRADVPERDRLDDQVVGSLIGITR